MECITLVENVGFDACLSILSYNALYSAVCILFRHTGATQHTQVTM